MTAWLNFRSTDRVFLFLEALQAHIGPAEESPWIEKKVYNYTLEYTM